MRTIVKLMLLWDPTPCCLIKEYGGLGETFQRFQDGQYVFKLMLFSLCHLQCKQECLWTAKCCQVQVLYYFHRSYVLVNFSTGYVSRDDVSRGRCSYKRNSKMGGDGSKLF